MKYNFTRILSVGCICTMLLGVQAFAVPVIEEDTDADTTIEMDIGEDTQTNVSDENIVADENADASEVDSDEDSVSEDADVENIDVEDVVDGPIYAPIETIDLSNARASVMVVALKDSKVYAEAGTSSGVVGTMTMGMVRTVLSTSGNFCKVKIDGTNVWVHQKNVADVSTVTIKVTAKVDCNVYSEASTTSDVVTTIPSGTTRTVLNYSGNFYKIKMNGLLGWIKMNSGNFTIEITEPEVDSAYDAIAALAKTKVGCAYVYGATGPNSFDCSGLAYYCYRNNGITSIPRVSKDQYSSCTKVSQSALQPGYLVFFDCSGSDGVVDHVGIYIGNNQFVHAANPDDGVMINNLTENYYKTRYIGGGYFS